MAKGRGKAKEDENIIKGGNGEEEVAEQKGIKAGIVSVIFHGV
jgi:hypothetical protein